MCLIAKPHDCPAMPESALSTHGTSAFAVLMSGPTFRPTTQAVGLDVVVGAFVVGVGCPTAQLRVIAQVASGPFWSVPMPAAPGLRPFEDFVSEW